VSVNVALQGAHIRIEDNGIGIDREHLDKIFLMFYRATESRSGSGLGLYIVKETIETLQGQIKVQSRIGEGTVFTISLPNLQAAPLPNEPTPHEKALSENGEDVFPSRLSGGAATPVSRSGESGRSA
jgi:K+-sensing histidine kinase KdpD